MKQVRVGYSIRLGLGAPTLHISSQLQVQWLAVRQVAYHWPWILGNTTDQNFLSPSQPLSLPFLFSQSWWLSICHPPPSHWTLRLKWFPRHSWVETKTHSLLVAHHESGLACSPSSTTSDTRLIISIQLIQSNTYNASFSHIPLNYNQETSGVKVPWAWLYLVLKGKILLLFSNFVWGWVDSLGFRRLRKNGNGSLLLLHLLFS